MTRARYERLTIILAGVVLSYGIFAYQWTQNINGLPSLLSAPLTLLTSAALFKLLLVACYSAVSRSDRLLSFYFAPERYWRGYWHYTSINEGRVHLGIWYVEQSVRGTRIFAYGLDENYQRRFEAESIADPIERADGIFEVIYGFESNADAGRRVFAKTRVKPDQPEGRWHSARGPKILRGTTFNYGGALNESMFMNVKFVRHGDVLNEDGLVAKLRTEEIRHGAPAT